MLSPDVLQIWIKNTSEVNATYLNQREVEPQGMPLRNMDVFQIGDRKFRYECTEVSSMRPCGDDPCCIRFQIHSHIYIHIYSHNHSHSHSHGHIHFYSHIHISTRFHIPALISIHIPPAIAL